MSASHSASRGRISRSAKVRASARSSFCSSVRAKETPAAVLSSIATIESSRRLIDWSVNDTRRTANRIDPYD